MIREVLLVRSALAHEVEDAGTEIAPGDYAGPVIALIIIVAAIIIARRVSKRKI